MTAAKELQKKMTLMRQKNDHFFAQYHPTIYKIIKDKNLTDSEIKIIPSTESTTLEIDVVEKGKNRYFGQGIKYCESEAEKFISQYADGRPISSLSPPTAESFIFNRAASNHFKDIAKDLKDRINYGSHYPIEGFIPFLVVTGVGVGFHIEKILEEKKIGNLIIYEHNLDRFLTSLYTLDWEYLYSKFTNNEHGSIQLIISYGAIANNHKAALWNELIQYCPHFPFSTIFYNHLMDPTCTDIIKKIQADVSVYTNQWGHFDDEINQYNNARHNLLNEAKVFSPSSFKVNPNIPVVIVGGGPSLDARIDILKKHRDNILIISCGTSIGTLFNYNLKPHIHVELESDLITYEALSKSADSEFRKDILLIGAAQLNPLALNLFHNKCIFFKDSSALGKLFLSNEKDVVNSVTPTCTNAGVALAIKLGFNNIFLTGLDFGFLDPNKHHAEGSIYFKDEVSKPIQESNDFKQNALVETVSVHGEKMWTKPMYFTAKRRVEETIKYYFTKGKKVYNCSDGAVINNAPWTSPERFESLLSRFEHEISSKELVDGINSFCLTIKPDIIENRSNHMIQVASSIFDLLTKNQPKPSSSLYEISNYIFTCNNSLVRTLREQEGPAIYFLRGHVWIFLMFFFTYTQLSKTPKDREVIVSYMNQWIKDNREIVIAEMKNRMFSELKFNEDPWVTKPFNRHD